VSSKNATVRCFDGWEFSPVNLEAPSGTVSPRGPESVHVRDLAAVCEVVNYDSGGVIDSFPLMRNGYFRYTMRPLEVTSFSVNAEHDADCNAFTEGMDLVFANNLEYVYRNVCQKLKSMTFVMTDFYGANTNRNRAAIHVRHKGQRLNSSGNSYGTEFRFDSLNDVYFQGSSSDTGYSSYSASQDQNLFEYVRLQDPDMALLNAVYITTLYSGYDTDMSDHPNGSLAIYCQTNRTLLLGSRVDKEFVDYIRFAKKDGTFVETSHKDVHNLAIENAINRVDSSFAYSLSALDEKEAALNYLETQRNMDYTSWVGVGGFCDQGYFYGCGDPTKITWTYASVSSSKV
jgi:hypothetical protein